MTLPIQRISQCLPWFFAGVVMLAPVSVEAAPRGSAAWCEQMMDRPAGQWSINDHNAFDDHCKKQRAEMTARMTNLNDEDDNAFIAKMFSDGAQPPKHTGSGSQPSNTNGPTTVNQKPNDPGAGEAAYLAAQRAKFQKYLDEHGGSAPPVQTPQTH